MNVSIRTRQAYSEMVSFIELLDENDKNKIPSSVKKFFKEEMDKNYVKMIKKDIPIGEQNLKEETFALIALIYLKYLCNDKNEKDRLMNIYASNEKSYRKEIRQKYDIENIFKEKLDKKIETKLEIKKSDQSEEKSLIQYKESVFKKIVKKIKEIIGKI